jgi:hypothetical protein
MKIATISRNAAADAITALANNGYIRIYNGGQPASPQTAVTSQTLLAELTFGATAFGAASSGTATANAITADASANATGTAAWARILKSDGTSAVWDATVGTSGTDIIVNTTTIAITASVTITAMTFTVPE